jgi:FkbM family methyltransferase
MKAVKRSRKPAPEDFVSTREVVLEGRRFSIPIIAGRGGENLEPGEPELAEMLRFLLQHRQGSVVDVGANMGQSLLKVMAHDPSRLYVGFEASVFCCLYVDELIKLNQFANATLVPVGLSNEAKVLDLHFSSPTDTQATTVDKFWTGGNVRSQRRRIVVMRGDDVLPLFAGPIGIVKVDVEGAEFDVLSGLQGSIAEHRPWIICEILPFTPDAVDDMPATMAAVDNRRRRHGLLLELLDRWGYRTFRIAAGCRLTPMRHFDMPVYDATHCNYCLLPGEALSSFSHLIDHVP